MFMPSRVLPSAICLAAGLSMAACSDSSTPAPSCTITIAPTSHTAPAEGGTRTIAVTTSGPGCAWSVGTTVPWIGMAGTSGTGPGSVEYTVAPNPATEARTGTVTIGNQVHTLTQDAAQAPPPPPTCTYALTPASATTGNGGGTGTIAVAAPDGCEWTARSNDAWLTIEAGESGTGAGTITYEAAAHVGTSGRTGTISVVDQTFALTQSGVDVSACSYTVDSVDLRPCMQSGTVVTRIETAASCPWTVSPTVGWLTPDATSGSGSADISIAYTENYDAPREGVLQVRWPTETAGQNVRVAQAGCLYVTNTSAFAVDQAGGSFSFNVVQQSSPVNCGGPLQDACVWTASTASPWITLAVTTPRAGDQPVAFTVAPNDSTVSRSGTILVRDRVVQVTQAGQP